MTVVSPIKPEPVEATEAAKKVKRLIYLALEDYYDDANKRYRDGWTDKKVAEGVGASESFVKTIRESDFGPISEPQEIAQLRAEVSALQGELTKIQQRFQSVCSKNGWVG